VKMLQALKYGTLVFCEFVSCSRYGATVKLAKPGSRAMRAWSAVATEQDVKPYTELLKLGKCGLVIIARDFLFENR
jgi:hypothetical protein